MSKSDTPWMLLVLMGSARIVALAFATGDMCALC
jgi:hypothetical protein